MARVHKKHKHTALKNATALFFCTKSIDEKKNNLVETDREDEQKIILALETPSEKKCKMIGATKFMQFSKENWKCSGNDDQEPFSCQSQKALTFTTYNNTKLAYLKFKNLSKHVGIIAYLNSNGHDTCLEDRDQMILNGVKDVNCLIPKK